MAREFSKRVYESRRWRKCAKAYAESKLWICEKCHNAIHARREDGGRRVRFDADGNVVGVVDVDGEA